MTSTWKWSGLLGLVSVAALVSTGACSVITHVDTRAPPGEGGGGGGGGGGGSGGGGGGGGGQGEVLAEWIADAPDATGAYTLPGWLAFESPSADKTVQVGPDKVMTGFGANAARARSFDGTTWGLAVESKRENRVVAARIAAPDWQINQVTIAQVMGPDGAALAAEISDNGPQVGRVEGDVTAAVGADVTLSTWVTTTATPAQLECGACGTPNVLPIAMGLSWHRASLTTTEITGTQLVRILPTSGTAADTGTATFDLVTVETGRYPSSVILTSGAPVTREEEKLYATSASDVAPGGYFHAVMVFAPSYASGEQAADHDLLFFDAMNRAYVRASDSAIVLQAEGTDVLATQPLTWSREQALTVEVMNVESGRTLRVSGANEPDMEETDTAAGAFPVTGALYLLGSDGGSQECADLRAITFRRPM